MNTKEQVENGIEKIFSLTTICDDTSSSNEDEGQTKTVTDQLEEANTLEENPGTLFDYTSTYSLKNATYQICKPTNCCNRKFCLENRWSFLLYVVA